MIKTTLARKLLPTDNPEARRLWKKFQMLLDLSQKERRAVFNMLNSLAPAHGIRPQHDDSAAWQATQRAWPAAGLLLIYDLSIDACPRMPMPTPASQKRVSRLNTSPARTTVQRFGQGVAARTAWGWPSMAFT